MDGTGKVVKFIVLVVVLEEDTGVVLTGTLRDGAVRLAVVVVVGVAVAILVVSNLNKGAVVVVAAAGVEVLGAVAPKLNPVEGVEIGAAVEDEPKLKVLEVAGVVAAAGLFKFPKSPPVEGAVVVVAVAGADPNNEVVGAETAAGEDPKLNCAGAVA